VGGRYHGSQVYSPITVDDPKYGMALPRNVVDQRGWQLGDVAEAGLSGRCREASRGAKSR